MGNKVDKCNPTQFAQSCTIENCVRFYRQPSFAGYSIWLPIGAYDADLLEQCSGFQSCKIPPGILLVLYSHRGFAGSVLEMKAGFYERIAMVPVSVRIQYDTAYWCGKNPFDTKCNEETQQHIALYCSRRTDILNHQPCIEWCQQNTGKCDLAFLNVCANPQNQQNQLCACFLPAEVYEKISQKLTAMGQTPIMRPSCTSAKCAQSPMQPSGADKHKCPNINNVICELNVDNTGGTINTNIMDFDVSCQLLDGPETQGSQHPNPHNHATTLPPPSLAATSTDSMVLPVTIISIVSCMLIATVLWRIFAS